MKANLILVSGIALVPMGLWSALAVTNYQSGRPASQIVGTMLVAVGVGLSIYGIKLSRRSI